MRMCEASEVGIGLIDELEGQHIICCILDLCTEVANDLMFALIFVMTSGCMLFCTGWEISIRDFRESRRAGRCAPVLLYTVSPKTITHI